MGNRSKLIVHYPDISKKAWPVLGLLVTTSAWWLASSANIVHPAVLPPPQDVLAAFTESTDVLLSYTVVTALEVLAGFLLSAAVGVAIGIILASSQVVERMFSPLMVVVNAVPKIAFAPMLVIALDWGTKPILSMVFLMCFFPITLSTLSGLTTTPADYVELARSLTASRWQTYWKIRMPAAMPQIFVGLKVGMPLAAIGAVIGEFYAGERGLGYAIVQFGGTGQTGKAWASIVLVALISVLFYFALVAVERLLMPWVAETTSSR